MEKRIILIFSTVFSFILLFNTCNSLAGSVTLAWDPPDGETPDLAGYKIYYGNSSGNYSYSIDVGNVTTYTLTDLTEGQTYYFAATAYDTSGNESEYSNEISTTIPFTQY
jgi:fibronectin type 3 domain-containing protein